jgi:diguanylate cyclase (GGDEF)-like protein
VLSSLWRAVLLVVAVAILVGGAVAVERLAADRLLHDDAVATGRAWTEFLAGNTHELAAMAAGGEPSDETRAFLTRVKDVANIFLFKVYDRSGMPRYVSDELPEGEGDEEGLTAHNPEAAEAIEAGQPIVEVKEGAPPSRPLFYAEAYVPTFGPDGAVSAVVETYIDQTQKRAQFEQVFLAAAVAIGILIAIAFGGPAAAWYWRKREQERTDAQMRYLAEHDELTGLANFAALNQRLAHRLADMAASGSPLAVHCVDIDRFSDVNDVHGLAAGETLLRTIGERLAAVAGSACMAARTSGSEFFFIQPAIADRAAAERLARQIIKQIAAPLWLNGEEVSVTASVGIAVAPEHGKDAERLIKSARLALAKARSEGRGRHRFFSADLDEELHSRLKLERAIDVALAENRFSLHFQPLFAAESGRLVGFEALARLPTADGFIPPTEFIPAAERTGAIHGIGAWVLQEACATATNWPEALSISVNLSSVQFDNGSLTDIVAAALDRTGLAPRRLQLEITESLLLRDSEATIDQLRRLKELGVGIVMDDFGTGFSSLSYLWRFPFDKLKIDRSFMAAIDADASGGKILRTIVALGQSLGMTVCVEGIETERQAAFARMIEADEVQGFHLGAPAPATDVAAIILSGLGSPASGTDFRRASA